MSVTIRTAKLEDTFAILRLIKEASDNSLEDGRHPAIAPMDFGMTSDAVRAHVDDDRVIIADAGGTIVGFAIIEIDEIQGTGQRVLQNRFLYVTPEARKTTDAGMALLREMRNTAIAAEMPFMFNLTNGVDLEKKAELLKRFGFDTLGMILVFDPGASDGRIQRKRE